MCIMKLLMKTPSFSKEAVELVPSPIKPHILSEEFEKLWHAHLCENWWQHDASQSPLISYNGNK